MSPGKQASKGEAAAPTAAGTRLEKTRRRVRLSRLALLTAIAADPAGYAQVFVDAWLRRGAAEADSSQARLAHSLAPDVDLQDPAAGAQPKPAAVTAVRSAPAVRGR
ncbi:hypothetical protein JCM4814A_80390 [Streptomyces phaeofaciens JCM 4814]|uniref:Uncharacterized protein n=1 Tax=Streptomyces phaeofaciens TaxID=68254 RepID=A0A918HQT3_9ACTN|nr:hypothetical protein [Streptomyces phaeofaciens]GGT91425.1 hypothetical protein GCM10010226_81790 [Streptomyces phaeofaciens]